ncbi:hypothetical protein F5146DRAFT_1116732 [Armillaria mellea]|nr:hypothetical protein F5146DRAFT_1116732 [Armillaria mellea]
MITRKVNATLQPAYKQTFFEQPGIVFLPPPTADTNSENNKPATMDHSSFEQQKTEGEILASRPSVEWFRHPSDSPFKRGVPSPKKTKADNILDTPLHAQFVSSLPLPESFGSRSRSTTEARLEFFANEEWAEVLSPTSVRCKACGKMYQLDPRVIGGYYPLQWILHRKKCACIYMNWLCARRETDEAWFDRKHL